MAAYYNEIDPYAAQWLRNLIKAGHIAPGDVDERSIVDVKADDLKGYTQCHFFAGIGGWSLALRLAGWPDDRSVWTGSCPCQPFSAAGAGKAADDERHLWPAWFPLIAERHPAIVFGEQVEAAIGWGWLDAVFTDMESESYACGAAVLPACSVGAPHIRQRIWWVADGEGAGFGAGRQREAVQGRTEFKRQALEPDRCGDGGAMANSDAAGRIEQQSAELFDRQRATQRDDIIGRSGPRSMADTRSGGLGIDGIETEGREYQSHAKFCGTDGRLADADGGDAETERLQRSRQQRQQQEDGGIGDLDHADERGLQACGSSRDRRVSEIGQPSKRHSQAPANAGDIVILGDTSGAGLQERERDGRIQRETMESSAGKTIIGGSDIGWRDADWIECSDGKSRPVKPGIFPLAYGLPRSMAALGAELERLASVAGLHRQSLVRAKSHRIRVLRGGGNAIDPLVAAQFITAIAEVIQ